MLQRIAADRVLPRSRGSSGSPEAYEPEKFGDNAVRARQDFEDVVAMVAQGCRPIIVIDYRLVAWRTAVAHAAAVAAKADGAERVGPRHVQPQLSRLAN